MIKMGLMDGRYCPMVYCDVCGNRIDDSSAANVEWQEGPDLKPIRERLYFVHKECVAKLEGNPPGTDWRWQPMDAFFYFLTHNVRWDKQRAEQSPAVQF